jgi:hypothetical protein
MGRGLALQFKKAHPDNFMRYEKACKAGDVQPGRVLTYQLPDDRFIINFPTKRHWRDDRFIIHTPEGVMEVAVTFRGALPLAEILAIDSGIVLVTCVNGRPDVRFVVKGEII